MTTTALAFPGDESPFDQLRHTDASGREYWSARELMPFLGYSRWQNFHRVIEQAMTAAQLSGVDLPTNFTGSSKDAGQSGPASIDYELSRYGAYLTAMRGDSHKPEIAAALTYFAVRTHQAEVAAATPTALPQDYEQALVALLSEVRERKALEGKVAQLEPMAEQARHFRAADGLIAVSDFANDLKAWALQVANAKIAHLDVWDFLGDIHLIIRGNTIRRNRATAFAVEHDYVREKQTVFTTNTRGDQASWSPRLTPAGAGYAWDKAVVRITENQALRRSDAA